MLELERDGALARIFLNRPHKANALDSALLEALATSIEHLASDESLRVLVLGGRGRAFCGGADVDELVRLTSSTAGKFVEGVHRVCAALRALPVPVVARLHGATIGAGLEIAAACDLRVAASGTRFAMPEVRLGIPSVVEAALLPRLMGSGRAAWLVLTGEAIDTEQAYAWGLVEAACAPAELDARVDHVVASVVAAEPAALRAQKELLKLWEEEPLQACIAASVERFSAAYASAVPARRMASLRRK